MISKTYVLCDFCHACKRLLIFIDTEICCLFPDRQLFFDCKNARRLYHVY
jgi:hypothetical protein